MGKYNLLLVEDSPADVDLVEEVLTEFENEIDIYSVQNGVKALDYLKQLGDFEKAPRPDLILLDIDMPKMDGFEFLQEIKTDEELSLIPVIILTMSNASEDIEKAYRLGANCCITKPLGFEDFNQIMQAINLFWFTLANLPESR